MQRLEVSCAVRRVYRSLGVKGLTVCPLHVQGGSLQGHITKFVEPMKKLLSFKIYGLRY